KPVTLGKKGILCFRHTKPPYIFRLIVNDHTPAGLIFFIILLYFYINFKYVYGIIPRLSKGKSIQTHTILSNSNTFSAKCKTINILIFSSIRFYIISLLKLYVYASWLESINILFTFILRQQQ